MPFGLVCIECLDSLDAKPICNTVRRDVQVSVRSYDFFLSLPLGYMLINFHHSVPKTICHVITLNVLDVARPLQSNAKQPSEQKDEYRCHTAGNTSAPLEIDYIHVGPRCSNIDNRMMRTEPIFGWSENSSRFRVYISEQSAGAHAIIRQNKYNNQRNVFDVITAMRLLPKNVLLHSYAFTKSLSISLCRAYSYISVRKNEYGIGNPTTSISSKRALQCAIDISYALSLSLSLTLGIFMHWPLTKYKP